MATFKTYSFDKVNAIWGIIEFEEFAEGDDIINITVPENLFNSIAGGKGDVIRTKTNDNRVVITIRLLQTSVTNVALTAAFLLDRETDTAVFPMTINNKDNGKTYIVNNSWIAKYPDNTIGVSPNAIIWEFHGDYLTPVIEE